ncbi:MAG TPA: site-specific integrase [Anaerolineales bacterium]|nr:site-specific integrase [Anaerolineales bacterium]
MTKIVPSKPPLPAERSSVGAYLASIGQGSRRGMLTALKAALAILTDRETGDIPDAEVPGWDWHSLGPAEIAAIKSRLAERFSPAYGNKVLAAIKGVLRSSWRLGQISRDEYARAVDLKPIRGKRLPAGRELTPGELAALLNTCQADPSPAGPRDAALFGMGAYAGLRIAEAAGLSVSDYDLEAKSLRIIGKGSKERLVFVNGGTSDALEDWLSLRGAEFGPLFCPVGKGGTIRHSSISTTALQKVLAKRQRQSGVANFTWHDLRRTCIGEDLDAGVDLATVQAKVGHSDPRTTARYDRRGARAQIDAAAKRHMPYSRRAKE